MKALDYLYRMKQRNDEMGMPAINIDEAIEEIETLQQELKKSQDSYNMIWNMYSHLRRENHKPKKSDTYTYKKKQN